MTIPTRRCNPGPWPCLLGLASSLLVAATAAAATVEVTVTDFEFLPPQVEINVGDTVRWSNLDGHHHLQAEDGEFQNAAGPAHTPGAWLFTHVFEQPGEYPYFCTVHGGPGGQGQSGVIVVTGQAPEEPETNPFLVNDGLAGAWFDPQSPGQGLFIEVSESLALLSLAWFTWSQEGQQRDWFTASGNFSGDSASLTLFRSHGGRFNDPAVVDTVEVGSLQLEFSDCGTLVFDYLIDDDASERSGRIDMVRVLPATARCLEVNPSD